MLTVMRLDQVDCGDFPRKELLRRAHIASRFGWDVRFTWTCVGCGTRCASSDLNLLYGEGGCPRCGQGTTIVRGGFLLEAVEPNRIMMGWRALPEEVRYSAEHFPAAA